MPRNRPGKYAARPLYTAPPAPVVPEEKCDDDGNTTSEFDHGWNQCRAAMLQGAEQQNRQQNIPENIPVTQFKPVADLYGLTSPNGGETSFTFDAVEARDFIDGGWLCQEYVTLERYQEAMLQGAEPVSQRYKLPDGFDFDRFNDVVWLEAVASNPHMHSPTTSTIAMVALELNRKLATGNSPAIPEGCCIMPKKLTAENGAKGALSGEFSENKFINCPECFGDDECETCDGSGRIEISVPVSWTTIKEIWAKGVEHFAAAPQQEAE
ncbi:hypothetical protein [Citrobacter amalonaticus]|uniref:hypothetical protein n=1 Tax=Citrobacter amalonaticus TaxID=35703 RepID=UPI003F54F070